MELSEIRTEIDEIDHELTLLFRRRMELAAAAAAAKQKNGMGVLDQNREREILRKVSGEAGEELGGYARILFSTLFDLSRSYQYNLRTEEKPLAGLLARAAGAQTLFPRKGTVACQGVEGAYSQIACDKLFAAPDILFFRSFDGVFSAVEGGLCEFGVLPIENSSYGSVNEVYDLMRRHSFYIVRSLKLHIDHALLAKPGTTLDQVKEIFSHEQALGQCSEYLSAHKDIRFTVCENTATAAQLVAESPRSDVAAISSRNCAALYGLSLVSDRVQNSDNNYTRFICIAREPVIYPGADRISLTLALPHKPGALYTAISKIAALGININKLESRPIPGRDFEFLFYFDLEASVWSPEVVKLLCELEDACEQFAFLGSYSEV
jgi:chorismate mutase/prephenate dehydratase